MKSIAIIRAFILMLILWAFVLYSPGPGPFSVAFQPQATSTVVTGTRTTTRPVAQKPPKKKPPVTAATLREVNLASFVSTADVFTELKNGEMYITNPTIRVTVRGSQEQHAKVVFTYAGYTKASAPLAGGELRRQVAIKLLAQDLCNTLHVSWQFEPNARLQILEKYNPGVSSFNSCGARGYTVIKPDSSAPVPAVPKGSTHTLEAQINSQNFLTVWADGKKVWEGSVAAMVHKMNGPVGLRTDNAVLQLRFYAAL